MRLKEVEKGQLAAWYTLEGWFVTVSPAYDIDRVHFSFVKKGTNGGMSFDVYVELDEFELLCDDILSWRLAKLIENDTGDYLHAWDYVTGQDGSKEIHIGQGKNKNIVIQGRDKKKNMNAFVPVENYGKLRILAKDFQRTSRAAIAGKARKCMEEAAKYHRENPGSY